jgi:hypothetical protein
MDRDRTIAATRIALAAALTVAAGGMGFQRAGPDLRRSHNTGAAHLYVQVSEASFASGPTFRYPLHNGVPAAKPDFVYTTSLSSPFWVDPNGELYGITYNTDVPQLYIFHANRKAPYRYIRLVTAAYITAYVGLITHNGYVFVDFQNVDSARAAVQASGSCSSLDNPTILVYAPGSKRDDPPLLCFGVPFDPALQVLGLAIDPHGSLYLPVGDAVNVYGSLTHDPHLIRSVDGLTFQNVNAVAVDAQGEMYALSSNDYSYVAAYAPYASGDTKPVRTFAYPTPMKWGGNIAVDDSFVYVAAGGEVLVYDKRARGRVAPHAVLKVEGGSQGQASNVEVGP